MLYDFWGKVRERLQRPLGSFPLAALTVGAVSYSPWGCSYLTSQGTDMGVLPPDHEEACRRTTSSAWGMCRHGSRILQTHIWLNSELAGLLSVPSWKGEEKDGDRASSEERHSCVGRSGMHQCPVAQGEERLVWDSCPEPLPRGLPLMSKL